MPMPLRRFVVLFWFAAAASVASGCASPASPTFAPTGSATVVASPASSQPPAGPLVTVETRGGECPQGACGSTIVIEASGRVHATAPAPLELGSLPDVLLEGLATEISKADFAAVESHPFTGTCPVAFDGQETVYTFTTPSGPERIASCEVDIDPAQPLFVAVSAALAATER
jgi:hypothetical protein